MKPFERLREMLIQNNGKAVIIPHADEWQNEYLPQFKERLSFATDFTGSAGCAVISQDKAALFTDGRYTLQAKSQLDTSFFDVVHSGTISIVDWIEKNLQGEGSVFIDPKCHSVKESENLSKLDLKFQEKNWVDLIWENRPRYNQEPAFDMDERYLDHSFEDKKNLILKSMNADVLILSSPESICWLLNKRGRDIKHTPVFLSFAILESNGSFEVFSNVFGKPLEDFEKYLRLIENKKVSIDPARCSMWVEDLLKKQSNTVLRIQDPCLILKACKTPSELNGMRHAHKLDAIAMIEFLAFLENSNQNITEIEACDILKSYREKEKTFLSLSFSTISGADANGAIIHYKPDRNNCGLITHDSIYLLDSGAQYRSGTTDITRTMAFHDNISMNIKNAYTAVLKGVIHLSCAKFPKGTTGHRLDTLARYHLWQQGLDYDHGTGHGVGCVLSVHEGPHGISSHPGNTTPLMPGMVVSIEPGYYKPGEFGIRIENLAIVVESSQFENYLEFETLTLVPINERLINFELLDNNERKWLENYNSEILEELQDSLSPQGKAFLKIIR